MGTTNNKSVKKARKALTASLAQTHLLQVKVWESCGNDPHLNKDRLEAATKAQLHGIYEIGQLSGIPWWEIDRAITLAIEASVLVS